MKSFLEEYGFAILSAIVVILLIMMISPVGDAVKDSLSGTVNKFALAADGANNKMEDAFKFDESVKTDKAGMYKNGTMVKTWDELIDEGAIVVSGDGFTSGQRNLLNGDELIISDTVSTINSSGILSGTTIESVTVPETFTEIPFAAFASASYLKEVKLPNTIKVIGRYAFNGSAIETIVLPASVEEIKDQAFLKCSSLKTVTLSDGLIKIGYAAFAECSNLEEIVIPSTVEQIDDSVFAQTGLKKVVIKNYSNNATRTYGSAIFVSCNSLEEVLLPNTMNVIPNAMFVYCANLKEITIPDTVQEIKDSAFSGTGIEELYIPASVKKLGAGSLYSQNLASVIFEEPDGWIPVYTYNEYYNFSDPSSAAYTLKKGVAFTKS